MKLFDSGPTATVAVIGLVLLAGCSGFGLGDQVSGGDGGGGAPPRDLDEQAGANGGAGGAAFDTAPATVDETALQTNRAIIRTGRVAIEVESFETARGKAVAATRAQGGFVSGSSRNVHTRGNASWTTGQLVLRVPSGNFSDLKTAVEGVGEVQHSETNRTDVTEQLVDLDARLRNLRAERDRLRQLYEQANETEDVLAVGKRLSDVQGEIERLEAKKRSLENRVAFSTLTVELSEPRPGPDVIETDQWYEVGIVSAFVSSVDGVVVTLRALAVGLAYALPFVFVFGVPLAGVGYFIWRRPWRSWGFFERW